MSAEPNDVDDVSVRLAEIRERANDATEGPWESDGYDGVTAKGPDGSVVVLEMPKAWSEGSEYTGSYSTATGEGKDLEFAAHARADIPFLLDLVATLKQQLAAAKTPRIDNEADEAVELAIKAWRRIAQHEFGVAMMGSEAALDILKVCDSHDALRAQIAEAKADVACMDYLETQTEVGPPDPDFPELANRWLQITGYEPTLRDIVRARMRTVIA